MSPKAKELVIGKLLNNGKQFFTVIFKKQDNSLRKMQCQLQNIRDTNLMIVTDISLHQTRSFKLDSIIELHINGERMEF